MYYTFFKHSMRNRQGPPIHPDDVNVEDDDDELFLAAERVFYSYYQFLKD